MPHPTITIHMLREREVGPGWVFDAEVRRIEPGESKEPGAERGRVIARHELRLSWADYNRWSPGGADRPEQVAAAVLRYLYEWNLPEKIPASFDAATLRRLDHEADREISRRIGEP